MSIAIIATHGQICRPGTHELASLLSCTMAASEGPSATSKASKFWQGGVGGHVAVSSHLSLLQMVSCRVRWESVQLQTLKTGVRVT